MQFVYWIADYELQIHTREFAAIQNGVVWMWQIAN